MRSRGARGGVRRVFEHQARFWKRQLSFPVDNVAMMSEPVEERGRHLGVTEDARPFAECEICRDDYRCAFVEPADEMEEQLPPS